MTGAGGAAKRVLKRGVLTKQDKIDNLVAKFKKGRSKNIEPSDVNIIVDTISQGEATIQQLKNDELSIDKVIKGLSSECLSEIYEFMGGNGLGGIVRKLPQLANYIFPEVLLMQKVTDTIGQLNDALIEEFNIRFAKRFNKAEGEGDDAFIDSVGFKAFIQKVMIDNRIAEEVLKLSTGMASMEM
jgi:hypothetical protein